jgi:pimeloyl-ACP methyl ester carboxylesterase
MPTIVLLHGAWADGSSWDGVVQHLQNAGYTVDVPPNPLRSLPEDSAYLASFLTSITGPTVLVGHSYGGAVITNAATGNPNVKALVYVDAFIPDQGETILQLASAQPGSCIGGDPTQVFNFVPYPGGPTGDVDLYVKQSLFPSCFANGLPAPQAAVLASTQRPLALSALSEPSGTPAWKTIPSWSLVGTADNVLPPAEQLFMSQRAHAHITQLAVPHLAMIARPEAVAGIIIQAAQATE